ncbi:MAG: pentapeptide repeat-containing protein [Bacteriovoracia bacterium]
MFTQTIEKTQLESSESYQLIKDEQLASVVISSQVLAGSRILLSTYRQVVFSDCVFYACDFQGVTFENCVFENCSFEFSHLRGCNFKNCSLIDCNWTASSSLNSIYEDCDLDLKVQDLLTTGRNKIQFQDKQDYTTDIYINLVAA